MMNRVNGRKARFCFPISWTMTSNPEINIAVESWRYANPLKKNAWWEKLLHYLCRFVFLRAIQVNTNAFGKIRVSLQCRAFKRLLLWVHLIHSCFKFWETCFERVDCNCCNTAVICVHVLSWQWESVWPRRCKLASARKPQAARSIGGDGRELWLIAGSSLGLLSGDGSFRGWLMFGLIDWFRDYVWYLSSSCVSRRRRIWIRV